MNRGDHNSMLGIKKIKRNDIERERRVIKINELIKFIVFNFL